MRVLFDLDVTKAECRRLLVVIRTTVSAPRELLLPSESTSLLVSNSNSDGSRECEPNLLIVSHRLSSAHFRQSRSFIYENCPVSRKCTGSTNRILIFDRTNRIHHHHNFEVDGSEDHEIRGRQAALTSKIRYKYTRVRKCFGVMPMMKNKVESIGLTGG